MDLRDSKTLAGRDPLAEINFATAFANQAGRCKVKSCKMMGLSGSNSVVECDLAKVEVAGSNPVSRSRYFPLPERGFYEETFLFSCGSSPCGNDYTVCLW